MTGEERRTEIVRILSDATEPVSGTQLAEHFDVSRQVIVQDIALLRAKNTDVERKVILLRITQISLRSVEMVTTFQKPDSFQEYLRLFMMTKMWKKNLP